MAQRKRRQPAPGEPVHGHSGAMRTAWIIGLIALAFYIGALVQGHRGALNTSWHKLPATAASAPAANAHVAATTSPRGAQSGTTRGGSSSHQP